MLFQLYHKGPVLTGGKTETRRLWKRSRARVGAVHQARLTLFGEPFALLEILNVHEERLGDISEDSVHREGYDTLEDFKDAWTRINGSWDPDVVPFVVRFKCLTEVPEDYVGRCPPES